jgi:hypothetical protein
VLIDGGFQRVVRRLRCGYDLAESPLVLAANRTGIARVKSVLRNRFVVQAWIDSLSAGEIGFAKSTVLPGGFHEHPTEPPATRGR